MSRFVERGPERPSPAPEPARAGGRGEWVALSMARSGFQADSRFAGLNDLPDHHSADLTSEPEPDPVDPIEIAFAQGHAAGLSEARAEAAERADADADARDGLALSFARLDAALEEELRLRLRDTVAALCEAAIAPLAIDEDALTRRIERAVSMLARADDDRVIRLHPDDLALVGQRLAADWHVSPDPTLARGSIRVETSTGGVEDGPEQWRRAIAEALHQC